VSDAAFGSFGWDSDKAAANERKHGVSFEEAALALDDVNAIIQPDANNNGNLIAICAAPGSGVLFIVHCERADVTRIISARCASKAHVARYRG